MTEITEPDVIRCKPGYTLKVKLKDRLNRLIVRESHQRGVPWEDVGRVVGIPAIRLEEMEKYRKPISWCMLDRLLHFYHKQIEIRLVDLDK